MPATALRIWKALCGRNAVRCEDRLDDADCHKDDGRGDHLQGPFGAVRAQHNRSAADGSGRLRFFD